ncbi:hypothetical protein ACFLR1_03620 [Bacteroidota bacterium]
MIRTLLPILLLVTFTQSVFAGGPWPRKKNSGYAQVGFSYLGYNKIFNHEGKVTDLRRNVIDITGQAYVDYGLTDKITFLAVLPFKYVASGEKIVSADSSYFQDTVPAGNLFGLNMALLGIKYNIINKKVVFSAGLNAEFNTAKYDSLTTLRTGPGTFVIHPYLSVGTTFYKGKFYTLLDVGWRTRFKKYYHQTDFNFELGFSWNQKTYFIASVSGRFNVKPVPVQDGFFSFSKNPIDNNVTLENPNGRDLHTSLYPNGQEYMGYGLKFIQKINRVHINAAVYFGMGKMVAAAPSYNLGVAYQW